MRPTREQLAPLTPFERAAFEIADFFARPALTPLSAAWNSAFMGGLIYSCGSRRFNVKGLDNLAPFGKKDRVLLVANHRSFFDFFTISAFCYWRTNLTKRIFFPVRQNFFYDHPNYRSLALTALAVFALTPLDVQIAFGVRPPRNVLLEHNPRNPIDSL